MSLALASLLLSTVAVAAGGPASASVSVGPGTGLQAQAADCSASFALRARLQLRETITAADETTGELNVRALRLTTSGHLLSPRLRHQVQLAFGAGDLDSSPVPVLDAWVEYAAHRDLHLRVGQYLIPFDRARTNAEFTSQLVDRAPALSELNLDRDVGLTLLSPDLFGLGGRLAYSVGAFAGGGRNRTGAAPLGGLFTGRLVLRPFGGFDDSVEGDLGRLPVSRLALGLGAAYNRQTDRQRSTSGTVLKLGRFDYAHAAADLVFKYAGFSLIGEALLRRSSQASNRAVVDGREQVEWSRSGWGWLAQAGMMLTNRCELVGRFSQLFALGETDPSLVALANDRGDEVGAGLNYYFNGHLLKLQADWATRFGAAEPIHLAHLQLDATF
jgi:hypothetical protein